MYVLLQAVQAVSDVGGYQALPWWATVIISFITTSPLLLTAYFQGKRLQILLSNAERDRVTAQTALLAAQQALRVAKQEESDRVA